jgi:hypothetical protein
MNFFQNLLMVIIATKGEIETSFSGIANGVFVSPVLTDSLTGSLTNKMTNKRFTCRFLYPKEVLRQRSLSSEAIVPDKVAQTILENQNHPNKFFPKKIS